MPFLKALLVIALATSWLLPATAVAEPSGVKRAAKATAPSKQPAKRA